LLRVKELLPLQFQLSIANTILLKISCILFAHVAYLLVFVLLVFFCSIVHRSKEAFTNDNVYCLFKYSHLMNIFVT